MTFYDYLIKNGISKSKAIEYFNIYCFGGVVSSLEDKVYMQNLVECYEDYRTIATNGLNGSH